MLKAVVVLGVLAIALAQFDDDYFQHYRYSPYRSHFGFHRPQIYGRGYYRPNFFGNYRPYPYYGYGRHRGLDDDHYRYRYRGYGGYRGYYDNDIYDNFRDRYENYFDNDRFDNSYYRRGFLNPFGHHFFGYGRRRIY